MSKYTEEFSSTGPLNLLYKKWGSMKARCSGYERYKERYFNRGIRVCDEWKDWPTFAAWALKNGYIDHLDIDRTDNDKGYSPDNCRFVDKKTQNANRDLKLTYRNIRKGQTKRWMKPFVCCETGEVFLTEISASRKMGLERRNIGRVLKRIYKQVKGFTFKYIMIPMEMYGTLIDTTIHREDAHLTDAYGLR